jgi:hypothetical protein
VELYVIHRDEVTSPIVGRVLGKGLAEELGDEKYLIIDGIEPAWMRKLPGCLEHASVDRPSII